jgi:hypothetical protein
MGWLSDALGSASGATQVLAALGLGAGGLGALTSAYKDLGDIGERAYGGSQDIANQALQQTQFQPFGVTSATGAEFGVAQGPDGQLRANMALSPQEQAMQQSLLSGAQGFYDQAMMPTAGREQEVYNAIRAMQTPEEQRQQMALEERLANQGRLGVSTNMYGGTPEQLALSKAQAEAKNQASLMAMQQAQQQQAQQAQLGQQYMSAGYIPQAQLLNTLQATSLYPQLAQRGQLQGAGLFGEASMGGLEALLGAGQGQANLMGALGAGLLGGLFS